MISIVTPTYNSEGLIAKNIESVIKQNYADYEHIIIDNLSNDNTLRIIKEIYSNNKALEKLKIVSEKDFGISDAFNKGIRISSGDIIAILNSDDFYLNDNLFNEVADVFSEKKILLVYGNILFYDIKFGTNIRKPEYFSPYKGLVFQHPSMFIKRDVYDKIGLYNTNYKVSMDFEFYCRLARYYHSPEKYFFYLNPEPLVKMMAGGSSYINEIKSILEIKAALKEHGFWNFHGIYFISIRLIRTKLKNILNAFGLKKIIEIWRNLKWGNVVKQ